MPYFLHVRVKVEPVQLFGHLGRTPAHIDQKMLSRDGIEIRKSHGASQRIGGVGVTVEEGFELIIAA